MVTDTQSDEWIEAFRETVKFLVAFLKIQILSALLAWLTLVFILHIYQEVL